MVLYGQVALRLCRYDQQCSVKSFDRIGSFHLVMESTHSGVVTWRLESEVHDPWNRSESDLFVAAQKTKRENA